MLHLDEKPSLKLSPQKSSPQKNNWRSQKSFQYILLCLLTFVLSASVLGRAVPDTNRTMPYIPLISEKLDYFKLNKDRYDAVFIGSSRFYRQVSPKEFDQQLSNEGYGIKSFNFGVFAMKLPETYFWLEKILETNPQKLKWVFVEANLNNVYEPISNARTDRVIYSHTLNQTWLTLKYIFTTEDALPSKIISAYSHLLPYFYNMANLGKFSQVTSAPTTLANGQPQFRYEDFMGFLMDGYRPLDEEKAKEYTRAHDNFLANIPQYQAQVDAFVNAVDLDKIEVSQGDKTLIKTFSDLIKHSGARPIFVVPPKLEQENALAKLYADGDMDTLFMFNNTEKYANLYKPNYQYDNWHLNAEGATAFTQILATEFLDHLEKIQADT